MRQVRRLPVLCLWALSVCGCASIPHEVGRLDSESASVELTDTPFFPQQRYQCGPAALTTVLVASGVDVGLHEIEDKVYLPGRQGSLQVELKAAARTSGRMPYVIDGTLEGLHAELSEGRPVLVLQNLGIAAAPRWHYAVVVGIDTAKDRVILRSGTDKRRLTAMSTFLQTWRRSNYWAMVVLRSDEMPARVEQARYFKAIAALEQAGMPEEAARRWATALRRWPDAPVALFGLANAKQASGEHAAAERYYELLLEDRPDLVPARNNLALTLATQGRTSDALREIDLALSLNTDPVVADELRDSRSRIAADSASADSDGAVYQFGPASRNGIGKFYMGREISHVMGHLGAMWLERPEREREERTDLLIQALPLDDDDVVADIGAGTGYFSFPIAERVSEGKVLAVDIQQEMLDIVESRKAQGASANVETVLGTEVDPGLPDASVDLILIVDAYHEFSNPREMGEAMARALKPGGKLVLIEYRGEDRSVPIKRLHKMTEAQAKREMAAVGLEWVRTEDFLPQQHFLVFRRP